MKQIKNALLFLFAINLLWGIICAIPALLVFGFALDGWFPPSWQHPDSFFPPSRGKELWMFTIASIIFLLFYLHLISGHKGFEIDGALLKKYVLHFERNILITLIGLGFMFYNVYQNIKFELNEQSFMWLLLFTIPVSSLTISIRGFVITVMII